MTAVCPGEAEDMVAAHTMKLYASTVSVWCWDLEDYSRIAAPESMLEAAELEHRSEKW